MMQSNASQRTTTHEEAASPLCWSRRDWTALLLLAVLTLLFFWRILTPNLADRASFPPGDFSYQFWAFSTFEARELAAGRLPLWNPYTYAGAPFWADIQSAVLYPPSLLALLISGVWGFSLFDLEVEAIAHFWLAGTFTYLFARRLTRQRGAALLAAIAFAFGGYLTGYPSQQLAVLETDVWLPLLLYFTDRALLDRSGELAHLRPSLPDALAAGLVWGIALLAGHPQSALFIFYTFLLYVVFLLVVLMRQPSHIPPTQYVIRSTQYVVLILLIGLGLAAIAWLPALEYMRLSVRAAGFYDRMSGGFPLQDAIQMLLPGAVSFYSPLYVGVLPLLLALWAALHGRPGTLRRWETAFWGLLALGALLLSFGGETFLYAPLYLLAPGFGIFRDQERAAFIVSFALSILAAYGTLSLTQSPISPGPRGETPSRREAGAGQSPNLPIYRFHSLVERLLIGALGLVLLFFYGLNNAGWQDDSPFNVLLSRSLWLAILLALTWGAMHVARSWKREVIPAASFLVACYLLLAALDLFSANWKTNVHPVLPEAQTAMPGIVQSIRSDAAPGEVFRVYNEFRIYENYGVPYELEDTWGASPLRLAGYDELYRKLRMERVWELLNVKYVITWRQELYVPSQIIYQEAVGDEVTYVHRLDRVAPRAWLVYEVQTADEATILARLDAPDFNPADAALVPPGVDGRQQMATGSPPSSVVGRRSPVETGQVDILRRTPNRLALQVTAPRDGLLVLSEIYYPGWQVRIDGLASPMIRADYVLRGVPLTAGQHRVELFYRPATLLTGAAVSGLTLAALALLAVSMLSRGGKLYVKYPR